MSVSRADARLSVERLRRVSEPRVIVRQLTEPWLILGSSQECSLVSDAAGLRVANRRGGGGAVLLVPGEVHWIDLWIPVGSGSHRIDVRSQLEVAGEAWLEVLASSGGAHLSLAVVDEVVVEPVCFAGVGPGEVVVDATRKLVGITAWRSRHGTLVQTAVYRRRDRSLPGRLLLAPATCAQLAVVLDEQVTDLTEIGLGALEGAELGALLGDVLGADVEQVAPELDDAEA